MRWRGPSGQFLGSVRPRAYLAGAGARDPRREGWHHGRVGRARCFREARCERSPSPGSSGLVAARPWQPGLEGPRLSLSHARGEARARRLRVGAAAVAGSRQDARGSDTGNPGSSASGGAPWIIPSRNISRYRGMPVFPPHTKVSLISGKLL